MGKIFQFSTYLIFIFLLAITFTSCDKQNDSSNNKVMINDVNYSSLTEAVNNAKTNDTIEIYNDVKDNKNILVTKPLTIKGISSSSQTKPKFYGSLTINLNGETDSLTIENIELIHSGKNETGENNNNLIGINLIDGGLTLKSSTIALASPENADNNASGLTISRDINSINTSPIKITGNTFESYLTNTNNLSSAIKILSNQLNKFKLLSINEEELFNKNNFLMNRLSNQLISLDLSNTPHIYTYYATTSLNDFIKALKENQGNSNSTFILFANQDQKLTENISEITINEKTAAFIYGDANLDFNNLSLKLSGSLETETELNNLNVQNTSNTASIIYKQQTKK